MTDVGAALVSAIAAKDHDAVRALLAADVDFRGLTPGRPWEATTSDGVVEILFGSWFEDQDDIVALLAVDTGVPVEDTERVSYRLALRTPEGDFTAEQQAYYRTTQGRITHLRMLCSGFRPSAPRAGADRAAPTTAPPAAPASLTAAPTTAPPAAPAALTAAPTAPTAPLTP